MDRKWLRTTEIFDEYERRFAAARAEKKMARFPEDREKVLEGVKKMPKLILYQLHQNLGASGLGIPINSGLRTTK